MITILRAPRSPRGVALDIATLMKEQLNQQIRVTSKIRRISPQDIVIRWGATIQIPEVAKEINSAKSILLINNKPACRKVLIEHNIPVPKTYFSKQEVDYFPVIGRPSYHSQGRALYLFNNKEQLFRNSVSTYWSQYIPKDKEYRLFIHAGKIFYVCEKIPRDVEEISWNFSNGNSVFEYKDKKELPRPLRLACIESTKIVEANFAAVDVIAKGDKFYIIELNSAPTIYGIIKRKLAKRFCADCVGKEEKEDE